LAEQELPTRTDISINGSTATYTIDMNSDLLGLVTGSFTFRCFLTPTQTLAASREYRQLLGEHPLSASQREDDLAFALTQLKYRITAAPSFWTETLQTGPYAGDLGDDVVILAVLRAAVDAQVLHKAQAAKKRQVSLERALEASKRALEKQQEVDKPKDES